MSHVNASSLLRHFFVQKPFIIETEELQVGPISDGYLANIEARQRRNQLQHDQTMTSQEVMTSQHNALQIQPTQTHIQPTITPVITPHVYVSKPLDQSNHRLDSTNKMIAFIKSGENYQFAAGGHPVAAAGNHGPVVGQFGISPFHQQQTQVQFQTHRIGIDPQGNFYVS